MGFWENIGEGLFGTQTRKKGQASVEQARKGATDIADSAARGAKTAEGQAADYDAAARASMGADAADYMKKGQAAAMAGAEQAGTAAATAGTQAGVRAARTSGLSKGQAAMAAGQQAGDIYTGTFQKGLSEGQDRYQSATGQIAGQGNQMAGRQMGMLNTGLGAAGVQQGIGQGQMQDAANRAQNTWGMIGAGMGAINQRIPNPAAVPSDERVKEDIEVVGEEPTQEQLGADRLNELLGSVNIDEIAKKIRPVKYKYKEGVDGTTPGEKVGVLAQDLEKTPLASMVQERPDGVKAINSGELTGANLNLIIQLANKVSELEGKLRENGAL